MKKIKTGLSTRVSKALGRAEGLQYPSVTKPSSPKPGLPGFATEPTRNVPEHMYTQRWKRSA